MPTEVEIRNWLQQRQTGIGASEAADIVGLGFNDAAKVYRDKTGDQPANRGVSDLLRLGLDMEPIIKARYEQTKGVDLQENGLTIVRHPERPWQFCTPDFSRPDGILVQGKTVGSFDDEWGESGSSQVPEGYAIQVQQEMGVTGTPIVEIAALSRMTGEFRWYRLDFCVSTWAWLTDIEAEFWGLVQRRDPLPDDWDDRFGDPPALSRKFEPGKVVVLSEEIAALIDQRKAISTVKSDAEAAYDELTNQIKAALGDAESAIAGPWKIKRSEIKPSTFTVERKGYSKLTISKNKGKR